MSACCGYRMLRRTTLALFVAVSVGGCGASGKQQAVEATFESDTQRREMFEATLRVLDENPRYVDEFYQFALKHPPTLDRFFANTAANLDQDWLARMNARHLARHPSSVKQVMVTTLDEISDEPASQDAMAQAITARAQVAAMAITEREDTIRSSFAAILREAKKKPEARKALLAAMAENGDQISELLLANPELAKSLTATLLKTGADRVTKGD